MKIKHFNSDERGTITIEFVIWFPFLFAWFVGTVVFFDAYKTRSHAAKVTYTIGDIVARSEFISPDDMDNLYLLESRMLPKIRNGLGLRISSVTARSAPGGGLEYTVDWSAVRGPDVAPMTDADIPTDVMPTMVPLETVVITETYTPYVPMADWVGIQTQYWRTAIVNSPRFFPAVTFTP